MYGRNLLTNLKTARSPCLVCIYIYEVLSNCNKIVIAWNWCFVIFILFSRFQAIFSQILFILDGSIIIATGRRGVEVTIKYLNCANVKNSLKQKTRQGKNRNVRFSGTLKRSLKLTNYTVECIYNKSLSSLFRFEDFWDDSPNQNPN